MRRCGYCYYYYWLYQKLPLGDNKDYLDLDLECSIFYNAVEYCRIFLFTKVFKHVRYSRTLMNIVAFFHECSRTSDILD